MIGSEGTLGVITEVTLRLQKIPQYSVVTLLFFGVILNSTSIHYLMCLFLMLTVLNLSSVCLFFFFFYLIVLSIKVFFLIFYFVKD